MAARQHEVLRTGKRFRHGLSAADGGFELIEMFSECAEEVQLAAARTTSEDESQILLVVPAPTL